MTWVTPIWDKLSKSQITRNLLRRLDRLGYEVSIRPKAA